MAGTKRADAAAAILVAAIARFGEAEGEMDIFVVKFAGDRVISLSRRCVVF
jgi:hypothetical protein